MTNKTKPKTTLRVFADHYQFYLVDEGYAHFDDANLSWDKGSTDRGWVASDRAIYISTRAGLNDHRVRIFENQEPRDSYERLFTVCLNLSSGNLAIMGPTELPEEVDIVTFPPGVYKVTVGANNLGVDQFTSGVPDDDDDDDEMEDEEFFTKDEFEHYDIFLNPSQ